MARFQFPVKLHRFTTAEFTKKKAEYNAKYGYNIHIPAFDDIFHLQATPSPTDQELKWYKDKNKVQLGDRRYEQIRNHMQDKKNSFLRMMASPSPTWMQNIGTAMTFLDDVNDSFGTAAMIARLIAHRLPSAVAKVFMGPAGWMLMAADIANIAMALSRAPVKLAFTKPALHKATGMNPFTKKAKASRAAKLRTLRPSKGEIIEALQTTDNMFGVGISLGPIVGFAQDLWFGTHRALVGQKVTISGPAIPMPLHEAQILKAFKAIQGLATGGQELSDDDHLKTYITADFAQQVAWPMMQDWNPLDQVQGIQNIEIQAPHPTQPSTLSILKDQGIDWQNRIGFLHLNNQWATFDQLWDTTQDRAIDSFHEYAKRQKHTQKGICAAHTVTNVAQNMIALAEGEDQVVLDYHPVEKAAHKLFDNRTRLAPETTPQQLQCFADTVMDLDAAGIELNFRDLHKALVLNCNIRIIV